MAKTHVRFGAWSIDIEGDWSETGILEHSSDSGIWFATVVRPYSDSTYSGPSARTLNDAIDGLVRELGGNLVEYTA